MKIESTYPNIETHIFYQVCPFTITEKRFTKIIFLAGCISDDNKEIRVNHEIDLETLPYDKVSDNIDLEEILNSLVQAVEIKIKQCK